MMKPAHGAFHAAKLHRMKKFILNAAGISVYIGNEDEPLQGSDIL